MNIRGRTHSVLSPGGNQDRAAVSSSVVETQPLVSEDEYQFLAGTLTAEEYLSRDPEDAVSERRVGRSSDYNEWLDYVWLVSGLMFIATSVTLLFAASNAVVVGGIVVSTIVMVATLAIAGLTRGSRRARRS